MRLTFVSFMPNILRNVITTWSGLSQNLRKRRWPIWSPSSSSSMAIHWPSLYSGLIKFSWQSTCHGLSKVTSSTCQRTMMCIRTSIKGWPMSRRCCATLACSWVSSWMKKCWNSSLLSLFKRISISVQKAWSKLQKRILMPKNRLDSSKICSRIYAIPMI